MKRLTAYLTLIALLSGATLYAQTRPKLLPPTPPVGPLEPKDDKDTNYYPYGKLMTRVSEAAGVLWTLKGDAQLSHKDVKFISDTVLYNEDNKIANAPGKLRIDDIAVRHDDNG